MVIELEDALKRAKDQKQIDQKQILTAFFPQEQDNGKITS
jgi:hypothetical protein